MWAARSWMTLCAAGAMATPCCARACWHEAERLYGVPSDLLVAVARTESNLNPRAVNRTHLARTGTVDIGLMQINSSNLPTLAALGITERDLYDECTNILVGAWLLARSVQRYGSSWNAVGAYNAACTQLKGQDCTRARASYAWKVYRAHSVPIGRRSMAGASPAPRPSEPQITGSIVSLSALRGGHPSDGASSDPAPLVSDISAEPTERVSSGATSDTALSEDIAP